MVREDSTLGQAMLVFLLAGIMLYVATHRAAYTLFALVMFVVASFAAYELFGHVQTR